MPFSRSRPVGWFIFVGLVLIVFLAACTPAAQQTAALDANDNPGGEIINQAPDVVENPPATKGLDSASEDGQEAMPVAPTEATPPTSTPTAEQVEAEPTPVEAAPPEKVFVASDRPLEATNPSSVDLANGQYHFVEFFAYW